MLGLLRDPAWQFAGVLLAAAAIGAAFWIYWLQRQTKELAFGVVSSRRLLAVADEVSSRIRVELDGREIKDLHLTVYALKNSGSRAVPAFDFDRPVLLRFLPGQVVSAQVSSQLPRNLGATLLVTDSTVELKSLLLNPGDHVLIQVLLSPGSPAGQLDGRVIDISHFQSINLRPELPKFHQSGLVLMAVFFLIIGLFEALVHPQSSSWLFWVGAVAFIVVFGYASRWLEQARASSRRRISEL